MEHLEGDAGVGEAELLQGEGEVAVLRSVEGVDPRVHHRLGRLVGQVQVQEQVQQRIAVRAELDYFTNSARLEPQYDLLSSAQLSLKNYQN